METLGWGARAEGAVAVLLVLQEGGMVDLEVRASCWQVQHDTAASRPVMPALLPSC